MSRLGVPQINTLNGLHCQTAVTAHIDSKSIFSVLSNRSVAFGGKQGGAESQGIVAKKQKMRLLTLSIAVQCLWIGPCFSQAQPPPGPLNNPLAYPASFQIASTGNAAFLLREDDNKLMFCYLDNVGSGINPSKCAPAIQLPKEHPNGQILSYRIASDHVGDVVKVISNMGDFYICGGLTSGVVCGPPRQVPPF